MSSSMLAGKVAVVTGGSKGIGLAIVRKLLSEGAYVVIADKTICSLELSSSEEEHMSSIKVDITKSDDVEKMIEHVFTRYARLDILVNNAGISTMEEVVSMDEADWDNVMEVNAKGVFLCSKYAANKMKQSTSVGKIINIASQAGKNGYKYMGSYVASKHAVLGLTKVMALELADDQIMVNAVCPGIIETEMKKTERIWGAELRGIDVEAVKTEDTSQVPLGRTGIPEDVAQVVLFLSSENSNYITGESINVTGGMTMN